MLCCALLTVLQSYNKKCPTVTRECDDQWLFFLWRGTGRLREPCLWHDLAIRMCGYFNALYLQWRLCLNSSDIDENNSHHKTSVYQMLMIRRHLVKTLKYFFSQITSLWSNYWGNGAMGKLSDLFFTQRSLWAKVIEKSQGLIWPASVKSMLFSNVL